MNLAQVQDDEPALLLTEKEENHERMMLINEEKVVPRLNQDCQDKYKSSNVWYLDNGASNHMTGQLSKFNELDKNVKGQVKFGDGSTVQIEGKGTILLRCKNGEDRIL